VIAVIVMLAMPAALVPLVPPTTGEFIGLGRYLVKLRGRYQFLYSGEGKSSSVAVSQDYNQSLSFHVSGKVEASSIPADMRLQRMLGHIPALLHRQPKSVLVVGCGAGVTAGSFLVHPSIERVVICELEPLIPRHVAPYFALQNYNVVNDPRVEIVYDDARHFVLTCREQFDIITSDPIHPWVKGAATLYTREYFELCKRRLKPGGMISQWVPLYESSLAVVQSEFATFFDLFPEGTVWGNDHGGSGYDVVLLGQEDPVEIRIDEMIARMTLPEYGPAGQSLTEVGLNSVHDLLSTYAGSARDLAEWLAAAERNRDRNLRLQYLAGFHSSKYWEALIYREILERRTFPERVFLGSAESIDALRNRWKVEPDPAP
jgi:spermidine synthase